MFRIVKANTNADVDLVLQLCNSTNSFIQFNYKFQDQPLVVSPQKSRTVSGLDINKPIDCTFRLITNDSELVVNQENSQTLRNTYIVSMFRLPVLATDVLNHTSVTIIKVITKTQVEFWYVLGVRKVYEYVSGKKLKKIILNGEEYNKELFRISGNIPLDLIKVMNKQRVKKISDLHTLSISNPSTIVDNSKVIVITD